MIQSEGYVWPAFVAMAKSVTRRKWQKATARHYVKGFEFDAYDTMPYAGGVLIGRARVTQDAYRENLRNCPDGDYEAEGFAWLHAHPHCIPKAAKKETWAKENCSRHAFDQWRWLSLDVWVVRFEIIHVEDSAVERLEALLGSSNSMLF